MPPAAENSVMHAIKRRTANVPIRQGPSFVAPRHPNIVIMTTITPESMRRVGADENADATLASVRSDLKLNCRLIFFCF